MAKNDNLELEGVVKEALPNATFRVEVAGCEKPIIAHLAGKLKMNFIRVLPGDKVTVSVSPYDMTRGRIIWRYK